MSPISERLQNDLGDKVRLDTNPVCRSTEKQIDLLMFWYLKSHLWGITWAQRSITFYHIIMLLGR